MDAHLSVPFISHGKKVNARTVTNTMSARVSPRLVKHQLRVQTSKHRGMVLDRQTSNTCITLRHADTMTDTIASPQPYSC